MFPGGRQMTSESSTPNWTPLRPATERLAEGVRREFEIGEDPPAQAHEKIKRIVRLYQSIRPAPSLLPGRQQFDPLEARDLLPNIWLMEVVPDDPRRFRARLIGGALTEAGATFRKGQYFSDVGTPEEAARTTAFFARLEQVKRIDWRRGPSALGHMEHVKELERVIMPMAADGTTVDTFMCLTVFYGSDGRMW